MPDHALIADHSDACRLDAIGLATIWLAAEMGLS